MLVHVLVIVWVLDHGLVLVQVPAMVHILVLVQVLV